MEHGTLKRQTLGLACSNLCVHISYVVVSEAPPKPGTPPQIICEKRWEPSDELKSVAPPLFPPSFSFSPSMRTYASSSRPIRRLAEESCMVRRRRRGRTSSLRGWQPAALLTAGRGEGEWWREEEEGRWGVGREYGEGGGNPMRHREERQREGNASQHRESLSISILLTPHPAFPLCLKRKKPKDSHLPFSLLCTLRSALILKTPFFPPNASISPLFLPIFTSLPAAKGWFDDQKWHFFLLTCREPASFTRVIFVLELTVADCTLAVGK